MNQVIIVGRLISELRITKLKKGESVINCVLSVNRSSKNDAGEYEVDLIDCVLWGGLATQTMEYCQKGDVIGIKGRLQTEIINDEKQTKVIAERVTFLSSKKGVEKEKDSC